MTRVRGLASAKPQSGEGGCEGARVRGLASPKPRSGKGGCEGLPRRSREAAKAGAKVPALILVATFLLTAGTSAQRSTLTGGPQIARVYDAIFDARFGDVPRLLRTACVQGELPLTPGQARSAARPAAPAGPGSDVRAAAEVCQLLDAVSLWWQIQLDPDNRSRDDVYVARIDAAIDAIDRWTTREPRRAEAWFYLGGAYGARAQWRVLRGERLAAARDGKRIKEALEQALELDPSLDDAYFGIGLYHYYADVAPTAAKMLRWLLALPGGDKEKGLQEMLRARQGAQFLRSEADYQLHLIYLWYERQPQRALELLRGLRLAHPNNPRFPQLAAEVEHVYLHDHSASLDTWRTLLESALQRRVASPAMTEVRARLGMATELDDLFETDAAVEQLRIVVESKPAAPLGSMAEAQLQLGRALDRLGRRAEAVDAYRAAQAAAPPDDPAKVRSRAAVFLRQRPDEQGALAYRLSIEGWRALERGSLDEAARALSQSLTLRPGDQVTRYRHARLLEATRNDAAALEALEQVVSAAASTPPPFLAAACLDAARLHERHSGQARAIELYRLARATEGAHARTVDAASRALTRLAASR